MKSFLFVTLFAIFSPVQANDSASEDDCASRPYVGVCSDVESTEMAALPGRAEPQVSEPSPDCNAYPYVGICDAATDE